MKVLYLVRHAKAGDHSELHDFERELTDRGKVDAGTVARLLSERQVSPSIILSSPSARTLGTATVMADVLHYPVDQILTDRRIYEAEEKTLLKVLQEVKKDHSSVMLIGHNPGITEFANSIFSVMINSIATSGVIGGTLNIDSWTEVRWGCGKMDFYEHP